MKALVSILLVLLISNQNSYIYAETLDFFSAPAIASAAISPDGKNIVLIKKYNKTQILVLINTQSGKETTLINVSEFSKREASLKEITWIDNQYIAAQFIEIKEGIKDLLDTKTSSHLLFIGIPSEHPDQTEILRIRTRGQLVSPLANEQYMFLYAKSGIYSKVYKIDVRKLHRHKQKLNKLMKKDGGQFINSNEVASISGFATRWFMSENGEPKAVLHVTEEKEIAVSVFNDEGKLEDETLKTWAWEELFGDDDVTDSGALKRILPVAKAGEKNTFYCLDFAEEEKKSVYKTNYATGKEELVLEVDSFKIIDLILSAKDNKLIGVKVLRDGSVENVFLDSQPNTMVQKTISGNLKFIVGASLDNSQQLYYTEAHNQPGRYLVKNSITGKQRYIGSLYPQLDSKLRSQLIEDNINVAGIDIPYLLSLPEDNSGKQWPLIVLPHGGPIGVFDNRYFDNITQFFVANDYAVLRINFRGSSGYTSELKNAGKKQWGNLILTDILNATTKVISRSDINKEKVCAVGMSYGGYAAAMLTMQQPEVFQCAVSIAGVSDVNLYLNAPNRSTQQDQWLKEQVGDTVSEYESLLRISPIFLVQQLTKPLLIIHGAKDEIVDIEHAYRFKLMLEKYKKPFSWHIFPEGDHSLGSSEHANMMFSKVLTFLNKHTQ